ncbi:hypothetical protein [Streptomyces sp. NBC_01363]|uniref:hypothetical protein n=1 Tax=Streptomyces sp. NBC_01363 TaxID=2903840 RepID=UPI002258EC41|nr:hypothetical protein [Streptomyces sp. NBC_01363]MCX4736341.1 hypothetical protein [Streptomyces sp. NBC_01363]
MFPAAMPPRIGGLWRSTESGVVHAPQQPAELRRARRRAASLIVLAGLLAVAAVAICGSAVAHWGDAYMPTPNRYGEPGRSRPVVMLGLGLLLLVSAAFAVVGARVLRRPRRPTVELTPTVVRSNMYGAVEVPWDEILGARVADGPHIDLARPASTYRITGRTRREDGAASLRLYAPATELLPLLAWLREHPESRTTVLAPWSDQVAVRNGDLEK